MNPPVCSTCPFYKPCTDIDCTLGVEHGHCCYYPPKRLDITTYIPENTADVQEDFVMSQLVRHEEIAPSVGVNTIGCFAHPDQLGRKIQ